MDPSALLAAAAATVHVGSYGIYARRANAGFARPNLATWVMWVYLSALNSVSYIVMSGDPAKGLVAVAGAIACTITLVFALSKGRFTRLNRWDAATLAVGLFAAFAWWRFRSATYANLILQAGFFLSMIPTAAGIVRRRNVEPPSPWMLWCFAYLINTVVVALRWQGHYADLAYPVLNMFTHGGVGLLALRAAVR